MGFYIEISREAEVDLEEIFDYTTDHFGVDQAFKYVSSFDETFQTIADHPEIGLDRSEIRHDLRSTVKGQHNEI